VQEITITTASKSFYYDGQIKTVSKDDPDIYSITSGKLLQGHAITSIKMGASIIDVGSIANNISEFIISDEEGTDVSGLYKINFVYGRITIKPREIIVTTGSAEASFASLGGEKLTCFSCTIESAIEGEEALANGHKEEVEYLSSLSKIGRIDNKVNFKIYDILHKDVTLNYSITIINGKLRVTR
jgi:hypothetical protein